MKYSILTHGGEHRRALASQGSLVLLAMLLMLAVFALPATAARDRDGDGIRNRLDNCPRTDNPDQADLDRDGLGDACDPDVDGDGQLNQADPCPADPQNACVPTQTGTKTYTASTAQILNPERGWWYTIEPDWNTNQTQPTLTVSQLNALKSTYGVTVVRKYYVIDDFKTTDIPYDLTDPRMADLKMVSDDFAATRAAGMKLIPRWVYVYNTNGGFNLTDPSEAQIKRHIDQIAPILEANKDVLLELQAGFVGCWGEWHGYCGGFNGTASQHVNPDGSLKASGVNIYNYLMQNVPSERMVAMRYPYQVYQLDGSTQFSESEAYSATSRARTGWYDDSIAYDGNDRGTYLGNPSLYDTYMRSFTAFNVSDGEPSGETIPYTRDNILAELAGHHQDLLNMNMADQSTNNLYAWMDDTGVRDTIRKNLGYRFRLTQVTYPTTSVAPGGDLSVDATMVNDGWGKAFNPRAVELVLRNTSTGAEVRMPLPGDDRLALPKGGQSATLHLGGTLPADIAPGNYALSLAMEDPLLRGRPEYSIQLANTGVWQSATGYNNLGVDITVR
jgi:hypothetical protein